MTAVVAEGLYSELAEYYDLIYQWKSYADEARRIREILSAEGVPDGAGLADVACGTGSHLAHLQAHYAVRGLDASASMLAVARRKLPGIPFQVADMAARAVEPPVRALLCLFSAIGYVYPEPRLRAAAANFAHGLEPGGVLIVEPWLDRTTFAPGLPTMHTYDTPDLKLCRMGLTRQEADMSVLEFQWMAAAHGSPGVVHSLDEHRLWLCPLELLLCVLLEAGIRCRVEPIGLTPDRLLVVGLRV